MKILFIVSTLQNTGPINQLYGIIHHLDRKEFTPYIVTLSDEPKDSKRYLFEEDQVEIESLGLGRAAFLLLGRARLEKMIANITPDIIHTCGIRADTLMKKLRLNIPVCTTIRNDVFEDYIPLYGKFRGTVMGIWHERAIKKMKYPVCCSKTLKETYEKRLKRVIYAIQNGVDIQQFYVMDREARQIVRNKLKLPIDRKIIVVVGDLIERKDPYTIIRAAQSVLAKQPFLLLFIGDGMLEKELRGWESDCIRMLGRKKNVWEYFQAADFYISASKSEGLPNTVLEAGACGLPMILSDIPQHREIFEDTVVDGVYFFEVKNEDQLAGIIFSFLENCPKYSRSEIGSYIQQTFDSRVMSGRYQHFYRNIATVQWKQDKEYKIKND